MVIKKGLIASIIFGILLTQLPLFSQVVIKGHVVDSSNQPIRLATLSLINSGGLVLAFAISDSIGNYKIATTFSIGTDSLFVSIDALGYKREIKFISTKTLIVNFKLSVDAIYLPPITVDNNSKFVRVRKDTIEYNVNEFANKQDRVISDVLKRIPGLDIDNDGRITFQGKAISQLYIDGDNLLSGNYNLATNNIPVDFVSKVQVLENFQEILALKKIKFTNQPALNLVLSDKAKIKMSIMGDVSIGAPFLYNINLQSQMYKKKIKFINFLKLNNTGNDLKSDVISLTQNDIAQEGNGPLITLPNLNPPLSDTRDLFNNSALFSANGIYKLKHDLQLNINAYYLDNHFKQSSKFIKTIYLPSDTIQYYEQQNALSHESAFHAKIKLTSNKPNLYFNNAFQFESTPKAINSDLFTFSQNEIGQSLKSVKMKISNDLRVIKVISKKFALEGRSYLALNSSPVNLHVQPLFVPFLIPSSPSNLGLAQNANTSSIYFENYLSTSFIGKIIQNYQFGFVNETIDLNSQLEQIFVDGSIKPIADSLDNALKWLKRNVYFEPKYSLNLDRFHADLSAKMLWQEIKYSDNNFSQSINDRLLLPSFSAKLLVGKEDFILMNSFVSNDYGNVQNVFPNYVMLDYRTFSKNSGLLPQINSFNNNLIYNYRKTLKLFFASIGILYRQQENNSILDYQFNQFYVTKNSMPLYNSNFSTTILASVSKYIFSLRTTIATNISFTNSNSNQLQNNKLIKYDNSNMQLNLKLNSMISKTLNFSYDGMLNYFTNKPQFETGYQSMPIQKAQNFIQRLNVELNLNAYYGWKLSGEHYYSKSSQNNANGLLFLDLGWYYRSKNGKKDLSISVNNILNSTNFKQVNLNSNSFEVHEYTLRPASVSFKYLFRY